MGVTIHYAGELSSLDVLPVLLEELQDLANEADWSITSIEPDIFHLPGRSPMQAEGLLVQVHPEAEPLNMIFNREGKLVNFLYLVANAIDPNKPQETKDIKIYVQDVNGELRESVDALKDYEKYGLWYSSTKTQFAGPLAHITLCKLLRYLKTKYFKHLEVNDEGGYWETGEVEQLVERLNIIDFAINQLSDFFESYDVQSSSLEESNIDDLLADLKGFLREINKKLPHKGR